MQTATLRCGEAYSWEDTWDTHLGTLLAQAGNQQAALKVPRCFPLTSKMGVGLPV